MRLGTDVLAFEAFGIPLLGNAANGSIMGLTAEAAVLCSRMAQEDVPEAEVGAVDAHLAEALRRGGFLDSQGLGLPPCHPGMQPRLRGLLFQRRAAQPCG